MLPGTFYILAVGTAVEQEDSFKKIKYLVHFHEKRLEKSLVRTTVELERSCKFCVFVSIKSSLSLKISYSKLQFYNSFTP